MTNSVLYAEFKATSSELHPVLLVHNIEGRRNDDQTTGSSNKRTQIAQEL